MGKHHVPVSCYLRSLDAQFETPYPRSASFDTDTGCLRETKYKNETCLEMGYARFVEWWKT